MRTHWRQAGRAVFRVAAWVVTAALAGAAGAQMAARPPSAAITAPVM
jgi:hypothetical protein